MKKMWVMFAIVLVFCIFMPRMTFSQNTDWFLIKSTYESTAQFLYPNVGDVNNDGLNDLVISTGYSSNTDPSNNYKIFIFTQKKTGGMNHPIKYSGTNGAGVKIVDLNDDGLNDMIFGSDSGIGIYYQKSTGGFTSMSKIGDYKLPSFNIGDLNGDDKMDIIANGWPFNGFIDIYLQQNGKFNYHTSYEVTATSIMGKLVGDLNADNYNDLVIGIEILHSYTENRFFCILYQDPSNPGNFLNPIEYHNATDPAMYAIEDIDKNGYSDLIACEKEIYYQNTDGTLNPPITYSEENITLGNSINVADINEDKRPDLLGISDNYVKIYSQQADGTFNRSYFYFTPDDYYLDGSIMEVGDVNNDNKNDLIIVEIGTNEVLNILWGAYNSSGIVVQNPKGGSTHEIGSDVAIEWGTVGNINEVDIFYSIDDGESWEVIANAYPSSSSNNSFTWTVPYVLSDKCLIRIIDSSSGVKGENVWTFSIVNDGNPHILISTPNGGESLVAENSYTIKWDTIGTVGKVKIEYSIDNGSNWTEIISSTSNDGEYDWIVPNNPSNHCLIRISEASDKVPSSTSENTFSILEPGSKTVNLISPNGGESLIAGSNYNITWQSANISQVALAYSINNGSSWIDIGTAAASAETFTWTVPMVYSTQCLIRIRDANSISTSDISNAVFSITYTGGPFITVVSPNGGEFLAIGKTHSITWLSTTAAVGNVQIQYSINNGASWITIVSSTANDGSYDWTIPNTPSGLCLVRIREAADGDPSDISDAIFTIGEIGATLSITSPQNGDLWQVNAKHDIKWVSGSAVSNNVKLQYSTDNKATWKTITSSTANDGKYSWTVPNTPSETCNIKISDAAKNAISNISYGHFSIVSGSVEPAISLNRNTLYFGWVKSSTAQTAPQTIIVNNGGAGTLKWYVSFMEDGDSDNESKWLKLSNTSGTQSGKIEFYIEPMGLNAGSYDALIKVYDNNASNSPQMINVYLNVIATGKDADPFGSFETPVDGATVKSSIPVTGWVLDDTGIEQVTIWRNAVSGEGKGEIYVGEAVLVDGARPDVEQAYPTYPASYKAGWGYMMLTNFLPNGGNGTYTLHAYAKDNGGNQVKLGSKTITCDNAHADQPFGAIDTPAQGGFASGTKYRNQGWVLTPMPNKIPVSGSTIKVYIDGQYIGNCSYNILREDILSFFPGYANSSGAMALYDFDTTVYKNEIHTIQWVATDNVGNTDGIGSRYFTIQNSGYTRNSTNTKSQARLTGTGTTWFNTTGQLASIPLDTTRPVKITTGFSNQTESTTNTPTPDGITQISIPQDQRLVIDMKLPSNRSTNVYMQVGDQLRPLPPGASLDREKGFFYWQPGPASLGKYSLIFIYENKTGNTVKKPVNIVITTKNR